MRIIIETQNEGRILLEPEKLGAMESMQQETETSAIDAGPPSEALMNAIAGSAQGVEGEELEGEEGSEFTAMEEPSAFH